MKLEIYVVVSHFSCKVHEEKERVLYTLQIGFVRTPEDLR